MAGLPIELSSHYIYYSRIWCPDYFHPILHIKFCFMFRAQYLGSIICVMLNSEYLRIYVA